MIDDCLSLARIINLISNNYPCLVSRIAEKRAEVIFFFFFFKPHVLLALILRYFWTYIDDFLVLASDVTVFGHMPYFV